MTPTPLGAQAGDLAEDIARWAPDVAVLPHAKRLTYDVATNWKNVIDNLPECYHCHIAHKEFVEPVDMDTYEVRTHGIWSSHFAEAGKHANSAHDVSAASVTAHAVWCCGRTRFCDHYADSFNGWWDDLGTPHLDDVVRAPRRRRDALVAAVVAATREARTPPAGYGCSTAG